MRPKCQRLRRCVGTFAVQRIVFARQRFHIKAGRHIHFFEWTQDTVLNQCDPNMPSQPFRISRIAAAKRAASKSRMQGELSKARGMAPLPGMRFSYLDKRCIGGTKSPKPTRGIRTTDFHNFKHEGPLYIALARLRALLFLSSNPAQAKPFSPFAKKHRCGNNRCVGDVSRISHCMIDVL